jgi:hypothetical protein
MICRVDYHLDNFKKHFPKTIFSKDFFHDQHFKMEDFFAD